MGTPLDPELHQASLPDELDEQDVAAIMAPSRHLEHLLGEKDVVAQVAKVLALDQHPATASCPFAHDFWRTLLRRVFGCSRNIYMYG